MTEKEFNEVIAISVLNQIDSDLGYLYDCESIDKDEVRKIGEIARRVRRKLYETIDIVEDEE